MSTHQLDTQRLLCPLPVIRVQDKIKELNNGDLLEVVCTDPGTMNDIPAWCRINEHLLKEKKEQNHQYLFLIEVVR
ncbi:MAG: sulfurtransferase TusA family protein [Methylococcales bacterium]|nr:sulfurtransferase TusA family protein [Methylococcales bacterium]MBT7408868.1 sulfurtransferase TusA family protein [Methylococcales bacterium]